MGIKFNQAMLIIFSGGIVMKKTIITLSLIVAVTLIAVIGINILKPDDSNGDNLDELFSTTSTTNTSTFQTTENTSTSVTDENNETTEHLMTPEEFLAATSNVPSYSISWNEDDIVEYNGGVVTTEVTILNGSFKMEKGFCISLNGVLQECTIECDGKKTESSIMPKLILAEQSTAHVSQYWALVGLVRSLLIYLNPWVPIFRYMREKTKIVPGVP